jgi:putative transposase
MARMPRLSVAGLPHLIVQQGAPAAPPVFADDADRLAYLEALREATSGGVLAIHAYALLADGFLLLATPRERADLGRTLQRASRRYGLQRRPMRGGPLWAARFQATVVEAEQHLLTSMQMIEQAPVRAGLAAAATEWPWSSARHHAGRGASSLVTEHPLWWTLGNTPFEREARHERALQRLLADAQVASLLDAARGGWPLGTAAFVAEVALTVDRPVTPRPRGRPRSVDG